MPILKVIFLIFIFYPHFLLAKPSKACLQKIVELCPEKKGREKCALKQRSQLDANCQHELLKYSAEKKAKKAAKFFAAKKHLKNNTNINQQVNRFNQLNNNPKLPTAAMGILGGLFIGSFLFLFFLPVSLFFIFLFVDIRKTRKNPKSMCVRSVGWDLLKVILTLGLFQLRVYYCQLAAVNRILKKKEYSFLPVILLGMCTFGLYTIYIEYKLSKSICENTSCSDNSIISMLLTLFGLVIVSSMIRQNDLNEIFG